MAVVVLGTITFADFEVPDVLPFGGKHTVARHAMIGGGSVVDAMGPSDTDLAWDGIFLGPMAELRARRVDLLRRGGRKVILSWASFIYEVVVVGFRGDYRRSNHIPYHIELAVVRDVVSDAVGPMVERIEDGLRSTLEEAFGAAGGDPLLQGAVTGVQTAVMQVLTGGPVTLSGLGVAAAAGLQATAAQSFATATGAAGQADGVLTNGSDNLLPGRDPGSIASSYEAQATAAQGSYRAHGTAARLGTAQAQIAIPLPPPPAPAITRLPIPPPPPPAPPLP